MSSSEFELDSDEEVAESHDTLIKSVKQLDQGLRIPKHERSELAIVDSRYHLSKSNYSNDGFEKPKKRKGEPSKPEDKVLPTPLEKPAAERIKREIGFENTKTELKKWNAIVARNRTATCVTFPLNDSSLTFEPKDKNVKKYRLQSELEKKLAALEPQSEEEEDKKDEFPLTLGEILEKQKEAAKFRAQQSYKAAKAHRQNKIKSKKFHRIQRKEKKKQAIKEFEELSKTNPEAALEKLKEFDKVRAKERMTLRHKNTGQWAKNQQIRAKYDIESRQALAEQLSISKELTQKLIKENDSDEDMNDEPPVPLPNSDKENPWMYPIKTAPEVEHFISSYRKYWDEKHKGENTTETKNKSASKNNSAEGKNDKEISKIIEKPSAQNLLKSKSPDIDVFEKNSLEQNNISESSESENEEKNIQSLTQKKKLQKSSKDKLGIKSPKSKIIKVNKSKIKAGTSAWSVSPANPESKCDSNNVSSNNVKKASNKKLSVVSTMKRDSVNTESFDIDEIFDSIEDKIKEGAKKKILKLKQEISPQPKKKKKTKKKKQKTNEALDELEKLGLKGQKTLRPSISKPIEESTGAQPSDVVPEVEKTINFPNIDKGRTSQSKKAEIDPNKFMNMKPKHMKTLIPDEAGDQLEALDDSDAEEDQQQIISEAFADDDVVDEFRKEKEEEIKKSQPEDINMVLPGWGSWGGKNIEPSKRKQKRFILKMPKPETRRDENKGDVVIIEDKCPKIKKHLVSELPFPYTSVEDYEASIRAPIGREFVPEKTFSKLVTPAVKTKMGQVIEPMTEDSLVKINGLLKKRKVLEEKNEPTTKKSRGEKNGEVTKKGRKNTKNKVATKTQKRVKEAVE